MSAPSSPSAKPGVRVFPRGGGRPAHARRIMVTCGAATLLVLIIVNARRAPSANASLWSLFLAAAAFLYLWWLGTLLFDLVFVWHRYIRHDVAMEFLRDQHRRRVRAETDGPDDRPRGSLPAELPPKSPLSGPVVSPRPMEQGRSEGAGVSV